MSYPDKADLDAAQERINKVPYVLHPEAWEPITERGAGDCKDYVLGKLHALLALGWPIDALKIGIVLVEEAERVKGQTHAVLLVEDKLALDNRQVPVCTLDDLSRIGYVPLSIQDEGGSKAFKEWIWG